MAGVYLAEMGVSRGAVMKECEDEMDRLVKFFNEDNELRILPKNGRDGSTAGSIAQRKKVAAHMEDSKCPFSVLVNEIVEKLRHEGDQVTLASVRTLVLEIGLRVCFGISNTDADPLEDNTAASLRRWEVRELKLLPPGYREEISERRRRRRKIMERLASLCSAVEILRAPDQADCSDQDAVVKAREILAKTDDEAALRASKLDWLLKKSSSVPGLQPAVVLDVTLADSTNINQEITKKRRKSDPEEREKLKQEKLLKRQRMEEEKEQKRREKEEAEREKEAEKELRRKEKEETEKKRQEKEAEKELKRKEKEEAERKHQMALKKQASFMDRFLQASKKEPKEQASQDSQDSSPKRTSLANDVQVKAHPSTARDSESNDVVVTMDLIFQRKDEYDLDDIKRQHISRWRQTRREMSSTKPLGWGTRRKPKTSVVRELRLHRASSSPDATKKTSAADSSPKRLRPEPEADGFEDVEWKDTLTESCPSTPSNEEAKKLTSDKFLQLRTERKKLLQFDKSHRPPYYGTFSKRSKVIKPRNPLKQDPMLDYGVDSDAEWEEDEPGESLSDFENEKDEEEERVENDEDEDSADEFLVPDGYLSEGEGVHMEVGTAEAGGSGICEHFPLAGQTGTETAPNGMSREQLCRILDKATEHALRTNRPLIISNLGWESEEDNSSVHPLSKKESLIMEALRMRVLTPTTIGLC